METAIGGNVGQLDRVAGWLTGDDDRQPTTAIVGIAKDGPVRVGENHQAKVPSATLEAGYRDQPAR